MSGPAIAGRLGAVLRRIGLGRLSALEPKPIMRYERQRPGELIRVDTMPRDYPRSTYGTSTEWS